MSAFRAGIDAVQTCIRSEPADVMECEAETGWGFSREAHTALLLWLCAQLMYYTTGRLSHGTGCTTTSHPIYGQGGSKSAKVSRKSVQTH